MGTSPKIRPIEINNQFEEPFIDEENRRVSNMTIIYFLNEGLGNQSMGQNHQPIKYQPLVWLHGSVTVTVKERIRNGFEISLFLKIQPSGYRTHPFPV